MATVYKKFFKDDVTTTRTLLHEAIPITGSLLTGSIYDEDNIKNYSHGRFQSVYDYPINSSSANHILDLTVGVSSESSLSIIEQKKEKAQMYNQMAQMLVGHDENGNILQFDRDGSLLTSDDKMNECFFFNFARLLTKDEIKKGSFSLVLGTGSSSDVFADSVTITDLGADKDFRVNSPAGEYGILHTGSSPSDGDGVGLIYYQAGVVVLTASVFTDDPAVGEFDNALSSLDEVLTEKTIKHTSDTIRMRVDDLDFNNTIELNSTIYFCRVNHNEFNYSSNPTYLSESQIRVKDQALDSPVSYITTVGMYSSDNEL